MDYDLDNYTSIMDLSLLSQVIEVIESEGVEAARNFLDRNNIDQIDTVASQAVHLYLQRLAVQEDVVEMLLGLGAQVNAVNNNGQTALHLAAKANRADVVRLLLTKPEIKLDLFDEQHYTPLLCAVSTTYESDLVVEILLKAGASVSKKTRYGDRALLLAAKYGNPAVIKLLLEYDDRVNALNSEGAAPLDVACARGNWVAVKLLLCAGALLFSDDPERKLYPQHLFPQDHGAPLHMACYKYNRVSSDENLQHVQLLLKYALLERPLLQFCQDKTCYGAINDETFNQLNEIKSTYLHELQLMVCIEPNITLAQFILRKRLTDECQTDQILEILSSNVFPIYKEVIAGLLTSKDVKDGLQQHLTYMESDDPDPSKRVRLNFDPLRNMMLFLSDEDLLNLLLASYSKRKKTPAPIAAMPNDTTLQEIVLESEKYFKRARFF